MAGRPALSRPGWRLMALVYPFAAGAAAVNLFFLSLVLSWLGLPVLTPGLAVLGGALLGAPGHLGLRPASAPADGRGRRDAMSWLPFALALAVFAGSHYLPAATGWREALIARFGRRGYFTAYGLLSLLLLAWVIAAAGAAPYVELWPQLSWQRWVPNLAMPLAFVLAACGLGMAQPFTLGGRRAARFDPADPGLAAVTRHPLLLALALWSAAHLLVNGDLAHVILFGGFLGMSLAAMRAADRRAARDLPADEAAAFFRATALLSLAPFGDPAWRRRVLPRLARRALIGLGVWLAALLLHQPVIGVSPLPLALLGGR